MLRKMTCAWKWNDLSAAPGAARMRKGEPQICEGKKAPECGANWQWNKVAAELSGWS